MAYSTTYRRVVPVPRGQSALDDRQLKWLMAEGMWRKADADGLVVQSFKEAPRMNPLDVPPRADRRLGAKSDQFEWRVFEAVAARA